MHKWHKLANFLIKLCKNWLQVPKHSNPNQLEKTTFDRSPQNGCRIKFNFQPKWATYSYAFPPNGLLINPGQENQKFNWNLWQITNNSLPTPKMPSTHWHELVWEPWKLHPPWPLWLPKLDRWILCTKILQLVRRTYIFLGT